MVKVVDGDDGTRVMTADPAEYRIIETSVERALQAVLAKEKPTEQELSFATLAQRVLEAVREPSRPVG